MRKYREDPGGSPLGFSRFACARVLTKTVPFGELKSKPRKRATIQLTNEPREQRLGARSFEPMTDKDLRVHAGEFDLLHDRERARIRSLNGSRSAPPARN